MIDFIPDGNKNEQNPLRSQLIEQRGRLLAAMRVAFHAAKEILAAEDAYRRATAATAATMTALEHAAAFYEDEYDDDLLDERTPGDDADIAVRSKHWLNDTHAMCDRAYVQQEVELAIETLAVIEEKDLFLAMNLISAAEHLCERMDELDCLIDPIPTAIERRRAWHHRLYCERRLFAKDTDPEFQALEAEMADTEGRLAALDARLKIELKI